MHVFPVNLEFLVDQKQYTLMGLLVIYTTLLRTLLSEKKPVLEQMVTRVWEKVKDHNIKTGLMRGMSKSQSQKLADKQKIPLYIEKYIKVSDFLRMQL